jgi:hypothetical protein
MGWTVYGLSTASAGHGLPWSWAGLGVVCVGQSLDVGCAGLGMATAEHVLVWFWAGLGWHQLGWVWAGTGMDWNAYALGLA